MKLKDNFILRQVADTWVVVAVGDAVADFNGMLNLNESGMILWRALEQGGDKGALVAALTAEYEVEPERALVSVERFLAKLQQAGCLELDSE